MKIIELNLHQVLTESYISPNIIKILKISDPFFMGWGRSI